MGIFDNLFGKKKNAEHHFYLAIEYYKAGQFERALKELNTVIAINPYDYRALYQRGLCKARLGLLEQALKDFETVIELNPETQLLVDTYYNCGLAYEKLNQNDMAIEFYDKAITLKPDFAKAHCNKGAVLARSNKIKEAIKSLDLAISLNPNDAIAYYNRAICYSNLNEHEKALADFEAFLRVAPKGHPYIEMVNAHLKDLKNRIIEAKEKVLEGPKNREGPYIVSKWEVGMRIDGQYEIHDIKMGGMGVVYLCYDPKNIMPVAIKTLNEKYLQDKDSVDRFINEANAWVDLGKHKNIVMAYYVKYIESRPYIFLEYVGGDKYHGADLRGWISRKGLDLKTALNFAIQFCDGMIHAEKKFKEMGKSFVHRDIKPANIMVTRDRVVKVTDFGLVKCTLTSKDEIDLGRGWGTPPYMSPEQWLEFENIDTRSDIYSFGCVLYEMVCGIKPFTVPDTVHPDARIFFYKKKHIEELPLQPISIRPDCPLPLNALILKCLEKDPNKRYRNFKILRDELAEIYFRYTGEKVRDETEEELELWELGNKGNALITLGRYQEALDCFEKILKEDPTNIKALICKSAALLGLEKNEDAMKCCDDVLRINPEHIEAWSNKGSALVNLGKFNEAIECFDKGLQIEPEDVGLWINKGIALGLSGRNSEAIECCNKALAINDRLLEAWKCKSAALISLGQYNEAIECCNKAIQLFPHDPEIYLNRGKALGMSGSYYEAISDYEKFVELASSKPKYAEKVKEAREIISKIKSMCGEKQEWELLEKAKELNNQKRYREAIDYCDKVLKINPMSDTAWDEKVYALMGLGEIEAALECCNKAIKTNPNFVRVWSTRGFILAELMRYKEAIESFQKYIELAPPEYADGIQLAKEAIRLLEKKVKLSN